MNVKNAVNLVLPIYVYTAKLNKIMRIKKMKTCNLCGMEIIEDALYDIRLKRHKEFHNDPLYKRNTIRGKVNMI